MADISHYDPKYIKKVDEYLQRNRDRTVKVLKKKVGNKDYKEYENVLKVKLPTITGFGTYIGRSEKTMYNWANENPKFKAALKKIKDEQKQRLFNMGLSGEYNSTIAKLILSSNHGMKERIDKTSGDQPINNFNDEQVDRIADRINRRKNNDGRPSGSEAID